MEQEQISKYYRQKSHIEVNDEYYNMVMEGDLDILRKSFGYVVVTPIVTLLFMHMAKGLRSDTSMSGNFAFNIKNI